MWGESGVLIRFLLAPLRLEEITRSVIALRSITYGVAHVYGICVKVVVRWVGCYIKSGRRRVFDRLSALGRLDRLVYAVPVYLCLGLRR